MAKIKKPLAQNKGNQSPKQVKNAKAKAVKPLNGKINKVKQAVEPAKKNKFNAKQNGKQKAPKVVQKKKKKHEPIDDDKAEESDSAMNMSEDEESDIEFGGDEQSDIEFGGDEQASAGSGADNDEAGSDIELGGSGDEDDAEEHKKALERLKQTDPEFYQYLEENDKKLLNFNLSDDEGSEDEQEGEDGEDSLHKPSDKLEVASDESDYEGEDGEKQVDNRVITLKMIKQWQTDIQTDKSNKTITCLVRAFSAALKRVTGEEGKDVVYYKVEGSSIFNAVIQLCVLELGPALRRFLGLKSGSKLAPHKCKKFVKVKNVLKGYFTDLLKLLSGVTSTNILNVLLKHLHYMSNLLMSYPNMTKSMLKKLVNIWGSGDESVRVIAFLCILRITHSQQQSLLDSVLRMMYMTYVKNSKFVSVNTLPGINFMRRSLVEMYSLDLNVSYEHVFLFIRQLAINLRNAITVNKKENLQAVYNWQFVNSLRLWGNLLAATYNKPQLQPLVYPFVQICLGTIKLIPTAQYFPLRFHVTQMLMDLSRDTGVFIPVLPFILEVLHIYDFNKKHQKVSMKPIHFTCLLRLSKSQMIENGFKDTTIDTVYGQLLEYLSAQSQSIAFPDLSLFCKLQIKSFTKKCNVANYQRKLNQLCEKIVQNSTFIEQERKKLSFSLTEFKKISAWETTVKNKGTPLGTFFENWNKMRTVKKKQDVTKNQEIGDYNLPTLKKVNKTVPSNEPSGEVVLFPSDSEDEADDAGKEKKKRGKRAGKNVNKKVSHEAVDMDIGDAGVDVVEDFNVNDW